MLPRWYVLGLLMLLVFSVAGCGTPANSRQAHMASKEVGEDTRRVVRIPDDSAPEAARLAMGRKPDAVQSEGGNEIHYYFIRGAVDGEALRLVYKDDRLIDRQIVQLQSPE